jgi:uncharacterized damage-inducible protein DinB
MTDPEREVLTLESIAEDPEVGRWLSAMEDARRDTLRELENVSAEQLDWTPAPEDNTIGSLLYHIALVEADWLLVDLLGPESAPPWPADLLPFGDRDSMGHLTEIRAMSLQDHTERLATVRTMLLELLRPMTNAEFHRVRPRERFDVSPDWIIHHLLQHEAEHRSDIYRLREVFPRP